MKKGVIFALSAYTLWGFLPIYWKLLQHVAAVEVLAHRMVWSLILVLLLLAAQRRWDWIQTAVRSPRVLLTFFFTALLVSTNWGLYIWAVQTGHIVETSLGYFINPLVNVLLGVIFLGERPRPWQWAAIGLAVMGVAWLTLSFGRLPWIALVLAFSFAFYALLRKTATLESLEGLSLETALLFFPALLYLLYREGQGTAAFGHAGIATTVLLALSGVATAVPLLLFARGARLIPLSTVGLLQYIAPTMQFLLGVFVYGEPFDQSRLLGFCLIWASLVTYSVEGLIRSRRGRAAAALKAREVRL